MKKFLTAVFVMSLSVSAFAQDGMATDPRAYFAFAAAMAIALAAIGGTFAQGKASSVALEGMARNPSAADKLFTPMIIALALIESLVILSFVISFTITQQLAN